MSDQLERLFQDGVDVHRLEERLGWPRKAQELVHQRVDPVDFMADQIREGFAEIGVLITLRQELGKSLDRDERILDFVRHAGGKSAETREPVAAANLEFETLQRRDIGENHQDAQHLALLSMKDRAARAHHDAAFGRIQNKLAIFRPLPDWSVSCTRARIEAGNPSIERSSRSADFEPVICSASLLKTVMRPSTSAAITPVVRFCRRISL